MLRVLCALVVVVAAAGCFAPPKGTEFGIQTARVTTKALEVQEEYAKTMAATLTTFYQLEQKQAKLLYANQMQSESSPGEVEVLDPDTGQPKLIPTSVLSVPRASALMGMYGEKLMEVATANQKNLALFAQTMEVIADAKEVQAAWVYYLMETSAWNEAQRNLMNQLMEELR